MRATIIVTSAADLTASRVQELAALFRGEDWFEEDAAGRETLDYVLAGGTADADRVREHYAFPLGREDERVRGVLATGGRRIDIRLRGASVKDLKLVAADLIELFQKANRNARHANGSRFGFTFEHKIEIRSETTDEVRWVGEFHPGEATLRAFKEHVVQTLVCVIGAVFFVAGAFVTYPDVKHAVGLSDWATGFIEKIASAGFFAAIVAFLNIQRLAYELRQDRAISWRHV
jgi:hypothetical protein